MEGISSEQSSEFALCSACEYYDGMRGKTGLSEAVMSRELRCSG